MRRFLVKTKQDTIEGVVCADGTVILHGGVFWACTAQSVEALKRIFPHDEPEWLDVPEEGNQEQK